MRPDGFIEEKRLPVPFQKGVPGLHYLDHSATTQPRPEVVEAMLQALGPRFGNPSSLHGLGVSAERLVKESRAAVARLIGAAPGHLVFTSGGTEANNLAILGAARAYRSRGRHLITTRIEHPCVLEACRALEEEGWEVTYLPVNAAGQISAAQVAEALRPDTVLVSVMHVNNELGSVMPIAEVAAALRGRPTLLHVDAVQSAGKLPVDVQRLGAHLLTLSGHKIHGPKGIGCLYVRPGVRLQPLLYGGGQEGGLRSGTENVPGIVGLGTAAALAQQELARAGPHLRALQQQVLDGLAAAGLEFHVNGPAPGTGAPHILNLSFAGVSRGEVLVHALEQHGVYVSTGSACHSKRRAVSHVLEALRLPGARASGAIRVSFSPHSTAADAAAFVAAAARVVPELRALEG